MPRLRWTCVNLARRRDALTRRQIGMVLDGTDQEIEGLLCVRLYEFEFREGLLVGFNVVAVLHFVEPISRNLLIYVGALSSIGSNATASFRVRRLSDPEDSQSQKCFSPRCCWD
jgi:hypothetical protein